MANRPIVMARAVDGGGVLFFVEFPPGVAPAPVMLSKTLKDELITEMTGKHPIPDWIRLPAVYLGPKPG